MLKVYEVRPTPGYRDDDRAFVAAENSIQAKSLVNSNETSKMNKHNYDWIDLRAKRNTDLDYIIEEDGIIEPTFLFDNETYTDMLDAERRWFYAGGS